MNSAAVPLSDDVLDVAIKRFQHVPVDNCSKATGRLEDPLTDGVRVPEDDARHGIA